MYYIKLKAHEYTYFGGLDNGEFRYQIIEVRITEDAL